MYALIGTWRMCLDGARAGISVLQAGGAAGDAVERAVTDVEDRPEYTSVGLGGLPDRSGHVTLDAAYMDGTTLRVGGIMSAEALRPNHGLPSGRTGCRTGGDRIRPADEGYADGAFHGKMARCRFRAVFPNVRLSGA